MNLASLQGSAFWAWFLTGLGFFLVAAGVPISSLALFAFAVKVSQDAGLTWQEAAAFTGSATAAGHVVSYYLFRWLGPKGGELAERLWPRFPSLLRRTGKYLQRGWALTLVLRWVGAGYTQVFWLMGMSRRSWYPVICLFLANDYAWTTFWCAGVSFAFRRAGVLQRYVYITAGFLLLTGMAGVLLTARARRAFR